MTITSYNIAFLVDHESCLINIDILSLFIFTQHDFNFALVVPIENSHDFLKLEGLAIVVEKFRHKSSKSLELAIVKTLDPVFVNHAALLVNQEALNRYKSAKFIYETIASLTLDETQWVLRILE